MSSYWNSRYFFDCKPDCPKRKPGCQDHCRTYLDKRAELDALNEAERKRKEAGILATISSVKRKDAQARLRRNIPIHK